jgi:hypothetical protein
MCFMASQHASFITFHITVLRLALVDIFKKKKSHNELSF